MVQPINVLPELPRQRTAVGEGMITPLSQTRLSSSTVTNDVHFQYEWLFLYVSS